MESKYESIQFTRICITTTFPVGKKIDFFFSKSAPGRILLSIVLVLYTYEIGNIAKKPRVMSFLPWIGCQTVVICILRVQFYLKINFDLILAFRNKSVSCIEILWKKWSLLSILSILSILWKKWLLLSIFHN